MIEEFQRNTIYKTIAKEGWSIVEVEKFKINWWASEMWQLESIWSPIGKIAYVTFMTDPQNWKVVWEVKASHENPTERTDWSQDSCSLLLRKGWQTELPRFIHCLSDLRNK